MARDDFTGDTGYDVNQIVTASRDAHGHSAYIKVPYPTYFSGQISELVRSPDWPEYHKSEQAFIRDAIYHRLHWAQNVGGRPTNARMQRLRSQMIMLMRLEEETAIVDAYEVIRELIDSTMQKLNKVGSRGRAQAMINEFQDDIDSHEEPYRTKLLDQLRMWEKRAANEW